MPVAKHLRHFYRGAAWRAARNRILARAGGRFDDHGNYQGGAICEQCGKPDRETVETVTGREQGAPVMFWRAASTGWHNWLGDKAPAPHGQPRSLRVVISACHLNHVAGDDRDSNLKGLCQWCHLYLDQAKHRDTRAVHKDQARPLLVEGSAA